MVTFIWSGGGHFLKIYICCLMQSCRTVPYIVWWEYFYKVIFIFSDDKIISLDDTLFYIEILYFFGLFSTILSTGRRYSAKKTPTGRIWGNFEVFESDIA